MSTSRDATSRAMLGWVKPELDEILQQACNQIEVFVQAPAETERMRDCASYLHQVSAVLHMLERPAPAMLAGQLERLALALRAGAMADRDAAWVLLLRGIVLLPDYLERLHGGHRDIPLVLLPLFNEIRSVLGESGMDERVLAALAPDAAQVGQAELEHARGCLSGRNRALLEAVGRTVKGELLRIEDVLDLHLRTGADIAQLQRQADALGGIADTLGMMGLGAAREVLLQQRAALTGLAGGQGQADEAQLLDIVAALLYVDAALDDQAARLGAEPGSDADGQAQVSGLRHTVEVLAHEAISNFLVARELFAGFIEIDRDPARLAEVPRLLDEVAGALCVLGLQRPADYLHSVRRYVEQQLIGRQYVPDAFQLDAFADAVASLEYYLEALRESGEEREEILAITHRSLEALTYRPVPETAVGVAETIASHVPAAASESEASGTPAAVDGMLREILEAEVALHQQTLHDWLRATQLAPQPVTEPVWRAVHTLHDAFAMADVPEIIEVTAPAKTYLEQLLARGGTPAPEGMQALAETAAAVATTMSALQADAPWIPAFATLSEQLRSLSERVPDGVPQVGAVAGPSADIASAEQVPSWSNMQAPMSFEDAQRSETAALDSGAGMDSAIDAGRASGGLDVDALDHEPIDDFVEEGKALLDHCDTLLAGLGDAPDAHARLAALRRDLHTFKGGAWMAGLDAGAELAHAIESMLEARAARQIGIDQDDVALLEKGFDGLYQLVGDAGEHRALALPVDLVRAFAVRVRAPSAVPPVEARGQVEREVSASRILPRGRLEVFDRLRDQAEQLIGHRPQLERQIARLRGGLDGLERSHERLREQLRRLDIEAAVQSVARAQESDEAGVDPRQRPLSTLQLLSRALGESVAELGNVRAELGDLAHAHDSLLQQQLRVGAELHDGLLRARRVALDSVAPRLRRLLRQLAADTGKPVRLVVEGGDGELDRELLEGLLAPLEQLLRNAVVHGVETPAQRRVTGKPAQAVISLRLRQEAAGIVVEVGDDGTGLDREAIRRRAEQGGVIDPGTPLSDAALDELIFSPGLTTREQAEPLAGRGIGMDVVRSEVARLGGSVALHSVRGRGLVVGLHLPPTR